MAYRSSSGSRSSYSKSSSSRSSSLKSNANSTYKPNCAPSPTSKQTNACKTIASQKGLYAPKSVSTSWKAASGFIGKFGDKK